MTKSNIKRDTFIRIDGWMILDLDLKGNELLVYAIIYGFSLTGKNNRYTGSLKYLAELTNTSKQTVSKALKSLVAKNYITKVDKYIDKVKVCEYYATNAEVYKKIEWEGIQESLPVFKNLDGGMQESLIEVFKNLDGGMQESLIEVFKNLDGGMQESLTNTLLYTLLHTPTYTATLDTSSGCVESLPPDECKSNSVKSPYGEYQHVLLTDDERFSLETEYGLKECDHAIKFLDEYIEEKGYKSQSHYLAIKRWVMDAIKEKELKGKRNKGYSKADEINKFYEDLNNWANSE